MNVLFFCHADFASNSMGHIAGFAAGLAALGHASAAAIPGDDRSSASALGESSPLRPFLFSETWERPGDLFPDGKPARLLHAWTPREHVRRAVERCRQAMPAARVVIHLEDNEEHLAATLAGIDFATLRALPDAELAARLPLHLIHPRRYQDFLRSASGVTGITAALRDFAPAASPFAVLRPGVDFQLYHPGPPDPGLRQRLGLSPGEKIICYPGNTHFANLEEVQSLYRAVHLLNAGGVPCRLIRTGVDTTATRFDQQPHALHLGFVARAELPALLRLADILVQPGAGNAFNRYRLPSKLPEFLASGRPVLLPRANLAAELTEGQEALFLDDGGAPEEIARQCRRVFAGPALAQTLAEGAASAARRLFDPARNAAGLERFYRRVCRPPSHWRNLLMKWAWPSKLS